jgi:hypothetical protein
MHYFQLFLTDIADKYSKSSTDLISIIARIGAGISKDSLSRFISCKCSDISEQNEVINSSSFAVASFDNLDTNQSYANVTGYEQSREEPYIGIVSTNVQRVPYEQLCLSIFSSCSFAVSL